MVKQRIVYAIVVVLACAALVPLGRRARARWGPGREPEPLYENVAGFEDESYVTLRSLDEARSMSHTAVVMTGDDARRIYLTVPTTNVACDEPTLRELLVALDSTACNDRARTALTFELAPVGSGLSAESGGASIVDGVWLHPDIAGDASLADLAIGAVEGRLGVDAIRARFPRRLR